MNGRLMLSINSQLRKGSNCRAYNCSMATKVDDEKLDGLMHEIVDCLSVLLDRQMKALTGLSQDQFNHLLPVFSDIYQGTQQKTYEEGITSGTRVRKPGGGCKGKLPTLAEKLLFVLYYYKTYPTFDVLGTQFDMVRSQANEKPA